MDIFPQSVELILKNKAKLGQQFMSFIIFIYLKLLIYSIGFKKKSNIQLFESITSRLYLLFFIKLLHHINYRCLLHVIYIYIFSIQ